MYVLNDRHFIVILCKVDTLCRDKNILNNVLVLVGSIRNDHMPYMYNVNGG